MIMIKVAKKKLNKYGARKYAQVPSHSEEGKTYTVAKCRKRNAKHYYYVCSCPINFYKREKCHHIEDFIETEKMVTV